MQLRFEFSFKEKKSAGLFLIAITKFVDQLMVSVKLFLVEKKTENADAIENEDEKGWWTGRSLSSLGASAEVLFVCKPAQELFGGKK